MNSLKREVVSPIYLFFGEEAYLRDKLVKRFILTLLPGEVRDFNLDLVDGKVSSLNDITFLAQNLPFMSNKRLIIVNDAQYFKPKKKGGKNEETDTQNKTDSEDIFLKYLDNPNPSTVILFIAEEGIDKRKKLFTRIAKKGQIVEFFPLRNKDLRDWVMQAVKAEGKKINGDAIEKLLINAGSDLRQLKTEIEKLATYIGTKENIEAGDVEVLVTKRSDHNVFQIVDAVGAKKFTEAIKIIREMVFLGEQPIKILQMVGKQYRTMLQVMELSRLGYGEKQIAEVTASHPYVVQKSVRSSRNFKKEELEAAIVRTKEFDYKIKSGQLEPNMALELYLLS